MYVYIYVYVRMYVSAINEKSVKFTMLFDKIP